MADNTVLPGTGETYASDDVGGVKIPRVKLVYGPDGTNSGDVDTANPLPVTIISGGDGAVQGVDAHDAAITEKPILVGGYAKAAAPTDVSADGDAVNGWFLRNGAQCTVLTAAGALIGGDATNGLDVDVTRCIPGTSATHLGKAEDAAAASGDTGVAILVVRRNTASAAVDTDGDYCSPCVDTNGNLWVNSSGQTQPVAGTAAHDAAVSGNPVLQGLEARTAVGTAVSNGDAVRALSDVFGKQVVIPGALHEEQVGPLSANFTTTTAADIIAAQGAGIKIAVTAILVTNSHATVGTKVTIRDKTTTTRKYVGYAAAGGGGFALACARPLVISDANSAIEALCGTTGADVDVTLAGYLIKN